MGFTSSPGQDYFTRMNAVSDEVQKLRLELRAAEESRDALKRELVGEDPMLLPDTASQAAPARPPSSTRVSRADQALGRTDASLHRPAPGCRHAQALIASLEEQKKQELDARRKAAAQNPATFSTSTNPVFQQIKISLAEAEANVAALRARVS